MMKNTDRASERATHEPSPDGLGRPVGIPDAFLSGQDGIPPSLNDRDKAIAWALGIARVYMERPIGWRLWRVITDPIRANTMVLWSRGLITAGPELNDAARNVAAQAIEARQGGDVDSVHESAVGETDAPEEV